jgi:PAS domain S-box-containing protein
VPGIEALYSGGDAISATLKAVFDHLPVGLIVADKAGNLVIVNRRLEELWGRPLRHHRIEELSADLVAVRPDGVPFKLEDWPLLRALAGESLSAELLTIPLSDGSFRYECVNAAPLRDQRGDVVAAVISTTDVTALTTTKEELAERERRFRAIFDQTFEFIGLLSTDGKLLEANRTALDFIGCSKASDILKAVLGGSVVDPLPRPPTPAPQRVGGGSQGSHATLRGGAHRSRRKADHGRLLRQAGV